MEVIISKCRAEGLTGVSLLESVNMRMVESAELIADECFAATGLTEEQMQAAAIKFRDNQDLANMMKRAIEDRQRRCAARSLSMGEARSCTPAALALVPQRMQP